VVKAFSRRKATRKRRMFRVGALGIGGARRRGEVGVDMFTRDIASTGSTGALRKVVQGWACEQERPIRREVARPNLRTEVNYVM
jgi:hypothetical protein